MTRNGAPGVVPALVFGNGITALGVVRVLHDAGVPAHVIGDKPGVVRLSRWYRPAPPSRGGVRPDQDLAAYLDGLSIPRAVLIPCTDSWAIRIAGLDRRLSDRFPAALAPVPVLKRLMDKGQLARALCLAKLPRPQTVVLEAASDLAAIPDDLLARGFLKPRDSERFFRRFGTKAFWVRSRAEAAWRWQEVWRARVPVQFQEYIPGPPHNHYFLDGFIDRTGKLAGLFVRRRQRMYPPDFGNSTLMVSVPRGEVAEAEDSLRRLFIQSSFHGIFSAEFKRDDRDKRFKLLEVNVRPWWYVEFAARSGVDVVTMAYREALGLPVESVSTYQVGQRCVYLYHDYCAYRELRRQGRMTFGAWFRSLLGASQPLFRWSDPRPTLDELSAILATWLRRAPAKSVRWADPRPAWKELRSIVRQSLDRAAL